MTDSEKYDPDRMRFEDLDPDDYDALMAWFEHPNTKALHEDLGRAVAHEPPEVQRELLHSGLRSSKDNRQRALAMLRTEESAEMRAALVDLVEQANDHVELYIEKLHNLRGR